MIVSQTSILANGRLTQMLNDLEYSGFIRICSIYKNRTKRYQLSDYYSEFYFRFIKDNYGRDEHFWTNSFNNPARSTWAGLTFEQVCMDHILQIRQANYDMQLRNKENVFVRETKTRETIQMTFITTYGFQLFRKLVISVLKFGHV